MTINPKRALKSLALDTAKAAHFTSSDYSARKILGLMKIQLEPPEYPIKYNNGARAACCISIDFDHLTRSTRSNEWLPVPSQDRLERNSLGTKFLVTLGEKYSIPMTWAICGSTAEQDPLNYESILDSATKHEIGVHTYSHLDVAASPPAVLKEDIQKCLTVLSLNNRPMTFVFPWNREGNFDLLKEMGFIAYRGQKRVVGVPSKTQKLWNIPPVYYVDEKSLGAFQLIRKFVDICIEFNSVFHLWLHPWSIVYKEKPAFLVEDTLEPLFSYLKQKEEDGMLSISTMGDLALRFEGSQNKSHVL